LRPAWATQGDSITTLPFPQIILKKTQKVYERMKITINNYVKAMKLRSIYGKGSGPGVFLNTHKMAMFVIRLLTKDMQPW
jgi:hypothetical protein